MKARLDAALRRLGNAGVLGIGLAFGCGAFYVSALAPLGEEIAAQRFALERLQSRKLYQPASAGGRDEELRRFYNLFPPSERLTQETARLHRLGRTAGLDLAQGEYRLERRAAGLWAYRVTLPVRGSYPQLREFLGAILKEMPVASIEGLRFERKRAADTQLEAQVRVTVHVRPAGDAL
jgi:Type II secretion system (T2SS), protein M subtype b